MQSWNIPLLNVLWFCPKLEDFVMWVGPRLRNPGQNNCHPKKCLTLGSIFIHSLAHSWAPLLHCHSKKMSTWKTKTFRNWCRKVQRCSCSVAEALATLVCLAVFVLWLGDYFHYAAGICMISQQLHTWKKQCLRQKWKKRKLHVFSIFDNFWNMHPVLLQVLCLFDVFKLCG